MARVRRKALSRAERAARAMARGARELAEGARRSATRYAGARGVMPNDIFVSRSLEDARHRASRERRGERRDPRGEQNVARRVECAREVRCGQRAVAVWTARSVCALFYPRALYEKYLDDGRSLRVYSMDPERPNRLPNLGSGKSTPPTITTNGARGPPDSPREDGGHPLQGQVRRAPVPVRDHGGHPRVAVGQGARRHPQYQASDPATEGARE